MDARNSGRTGGQLLVDTLRTEGVERAFCVPGESYLAALDALYDAPEIELVVCRQEGGACYMAEADGKMTGRPGVCFVTRGPGATNASGGVHIAFQDSTPMVLFVGQIARGDQEREAFQEIDYRRMFGQMTKWVAQIDDAARVPEFVSRAFHTATSGRPGPVVLAIPEDMLKERAEATPVRPYSPSLAHPGADDMAKLRDMLAAAERPLVVVGGGGWSAEASADLEAFVEANGLPVAASFRCQDLLRNDHPNYAGDLGTNTNPKLKQRLQEADLLLVIGARLGENTTQGFSMVDIPVPTQSLVHVHPGAEEIGRIYQPTLGINAAPSAFVKAARALAPVDGPWRASAEQAHADFLAWSDPPEIPGPLQMGDIVRHLRRTMPADTIVTNGAGNFSAWCNRFWHYGGFRTILGPTAGSMGYGVPAAVAAKARHRDREVLCFAGDGDFLMNGQEFSTAVQYDLPIVVLVIDNGMYGTIRMHQERDYPGRVSGTSLKNPDFAKLAEAYGGFGARVERTEDFADAFAAARASGKPALLHLPIDPEAVTPTTTLTQIREKALAR